MADIDQQFMEAAQKLIRDRAFRADLDALSENVLQQMEQIAKEHMATMLQCGWTADMVDHAIAMLCGWIIGFSLDDNQSTEQHIKACHKRLIIAAVAAGWSSHNSEYIHKKGKH